MSWRVPLSDLSFGPEEAEAVTEVIQGRWLTMGAVTEKFERSFAEYLGMRHAIAVSNATVALHLACLAAGLGPGDEALVPSLSFVATANAVLYTGAQVRFADILGPDELTVSPDALETAITPRTKAILVMHYAGYPCRMKAIMELASQHGLAVIEDAAHAPGVWLDGKALGGWGDAGCFSFFSNKNLVTGEGGMLVTNRDEILSPFGLEELRATFALVAQELPAAYDRVRPAVLEGSRMLDPGESMSGLLVYHAFGPKTKRYRVDLRFTLGDGATQSLVDGSQTSVYLRGNDINQRTDEGAASIGMIVETTAPNQVLNVAITQDVGRGGMRLHGSVGHVVVEEGRLDRTGCCGLPRLEIALFSVYLRFWSLRLQVLDDGVLAGSRVDTLLIDMSTISPTTAIAVAEHAQEIRCPMLDAPVSGGDVGAKNATLSIMVGGDEDTFERARPGLGIMGSGLGAIGGLGHNEWECPNSSREEGQACCG